MPKSKMPITLIDNSEENAQSIIRRDGLIHVLCESGSIVKLGQVRSNRRFEKFLIQQLGNETRKVNSGNA